LLNCVLELLPDIYGSDVLSQYRMTTTPAHRPGAKNTKAFDEASAGLAVDGQHWYFQQRIECTSKTIQVRLFGLRGQEGNPIVQVLKEHTHDVIRLLELDDYQLRSATIDPEKPSEEMDLVQFISTLRLRPERVWEGTAIDGPAIDLPIENLDTAWPLIFDFIALFPIFRAATHILQGEEDRFQQYAERFWEWERGLNDEEEAKEQQNDMTDSTNELTVIDSLVPSQIEAIESALEGGFKVAIRKHRLREKSLRKKKIAETLRLHNDRLRCEVPGCGFDFFLTYGEVGRNFAHVHHKNPLSDRSSPTETKLSDLAIVCANCHAMIHHGGKCRALENLIPNPETRS
jgi:hypothetical protein